jgi:phenylalanyl-tRNA synthetase beta chain
MTISYNWLNEYLPEATPGANEKTDPEKLGKILTAIGLEVESLHRYEEVKGGLEGLVIGEVLQCTKHPDADKLSLTSVNVGNGAALQIVCGAPNVAVGQKVVVATVGATIFPVKGDAITIKKAKIRGVESMGMICAEDEIGLSGNHAGIMVLPADTQVGTPAAAYFGNYSDHIFEIGLTPNRMDAMSHLGVAKDVCAYLAHHHRQGIAVRTPFKNNLRADDHSLQIDVKIENKEACRRYSGVSLSGVTVTDSPKWLQQKLKSIGLRPINNIVDITNFILHETGQPLHAFDADMITGKKIVVKNMPAGSTFVTLDEKERKLDAEDLMIANEKEGMCIAGVNGGVNSGVMTATKNIFLESAWFSPASIRKTSFRHGLRTDAATRFEKGVDISNTVNVLKRAALMIKEIAGGKIASDVIDVYPDPLPKTEVTLKHHYLKKLSGKNYHSDTIKNILTSLGFEILKQGQDDIRVSVPFSKPDISIPADIVEEIMRIDGFDNVEIPLAITISPAVEMLAHEADCREKAAGFLIGCGFSEIFTNSITNAAYYNETTLQTTVKMINSLTEELNIMRPAMMQTGLESVVYNLNRKSNDLQFFEFGKTYSSAKAGQYQEDQHLSLYITGKRFDDGWKVKAHKTDIYFAKGVVEKVLRLLGVNEHTFTTAVHENLDPCIIVEVKGQPIATIGSVNKKAASVFEIKQPVFYADINWDKVLALHKKQQVVFADIPKYPVVHRDLSIVVDKSVIYEQVKKATSNTRLNKLQSINLFDIFENEKLGANKKSMAINFTFLDEEKTMTDKEIDAMMSRIIASFEKELNAEIRK